LSDNYSGRQKLLTFNTRASFVERVRKAGSCSNVGERAVGALVSPLDCFPVLSQVVARWVPPWYDVSRSDPTLPSLAGKHTAGSCWLSTKKMIHVSWDAGARVSLGARKSTHFCLEDRWRARTTSIIDPACRLLPSLVQVLPVVGPPSCAMLVVCRGDQQRTVAHRRPFPAPTDSAQGKGKEGLMGLWGPHASASSLGFQDGIEPLSE
jgi:hypothetical protein